MTTNHTKCNQKQPEVSTFCNLTEQWEKGELEVDQYYYVKYADGSVEIQLYVGGFLMRTDNRVVEVLAPVPNYEEWQALNEDVDTTTELWKHERRQLNEKIQLIGNLCVQVGDLKDENQQLKKLLWACQDELYSHLDSDAEAMADVITKVIGKKQW